MNFVITQVLLLENQFAISDITLNHDVYNLDIGKIWCKNSSKEFHQLYFLNESLSFDEQFTISKNCTECEQ